MTTGTGHDMKKKGNLNSIGNILVYSKSKSIHNNNNNNKNNYHYYYHDNMCPCDREQE